MAMETFTIIAILYQIKFLVQGYIFAQQVGLLIYTTGYLVVPYYKLKTYITECIFILRIFYRITKTAIMKSIAPLIFLIFFADIIVNAQSNKTVTLFKPQDKGNWYVFIQREGKDKDSLKVFQFEGETIHVSGEKFGYISTVKSYSNFHFTLEFKWGEKKYPPRLNAKRDAGVLYNAVMYSGDKIWPRSLEFQIQEGDCGDMWLTDSASMVHADTVVPKRPSFRIIKTKDAEKSNGEWNKVEVIIKDGKITHLMNGEIVFEGKSPDPSSGQIVLQSEGAELYYRNVTIREL
jgi:hypothetical protein